MYSFQIESIIEFEEFLFGDNHMLLSIDMVDIDFLVHKICMLPILRPFFVDKAHSLSKKYIENHVFRNKILKKSMAMCPIIIYHLYKSSMIFFDDVKSLLNDEKIIIPCFFFRKEIDDFNMFIRRKTESSNFNKYLIFSEENIEALLEYGFLPSSIEYCLKYDDYDSFRNIFNANIHQMANWNPFEWSQRPKSLDILSFSGHYGSIKCFKHILMNEGAVFKPGNGDLIFSGNTDIIHMYNHYIIDFGENLRYSTEISRISLVKYFLEKGANIDSKNMDGDSSLHIASREGFFYIVNYLIEQKADPNISNNSFETPLHLASIHGHFYIVEFLINNHSEINSKDGNGYCRHIIGRHYIMLA